MNDEFAAAKMFRGILVGTLLGTVEASLVLPLLMGSIPGSLPDLRLSALLPGEWLKRALSVVLLATGARMLW